MRRSGYRVGGWIVSLAVAGSAVAVALPLASVGCSAAHQSPAWDNSGGGGNGGNGNGGNGGSGNTGGNGNSGGNGGSGGNAGGGNGGGSGGNGGGSGGTGGGQGTGCKTNTGPITGTVGATGGTISRLVFAVAGDTRPTNEDDPTNYPTPIITQIYQDIEALQPHPPLVIGTGDYQFSSVGSYSTAQQQIATYMQARAVYTGAFFPAMGNHECGVGNGCSSSNDCNCGPNNPGGATPNYNEFMSQMLGPINQTQNPYYSINVNAADGSWTAKFVITAANAWDSGQESWLQGVMAQQTTYTFVVRHETSDAYPPLPPGVAGVDSVISQYPYTLLIAGHAHTYGHYSDQPKVVILGNGGAPLTSKSYGYGLFSQRCDGAIVGDEIDYQSGQTDGQFHFVIKPDGTLTN